MLFWTSRRRILAALLVLATAACVRLPVLLAVLRAPERAIAPDSQDYLLLACELRGTGCFQRDGQPEIYRTPGYPMFLAALGTCKQEDVRRAVVVQTACDLLLCLLVAGLTARLLRMGDHGTGPATGAAVAAGMWQALSVVSAVYAVRILSDAGFAVLLLLTVWGTIAFLNRGANSATGGVRRWPALVAWALLLAALPLWRAIALPFVLVHPFLFVLRRRFREALAAAAVIFALDGGWVLRNTLAAGYPGFSAVAAINLYRYEAAAVRAGRTGRSFAEVQAEFDRRLAECSTWGERARLARREAVGILARNLLLWTRVHLTSTLATLFPASGTYLQTLGVQLGGGTLAVLHDRGLVAAVRHFFRDRPGIMIAALLLAVPLVLKYIAAAVGTWGMVRLTHLRVACLYIAGTAAWFILAPGPAAHPRFRVPVEPLLSVCAALGCAVLCSWGAPRSPQSGKAEGKRLAG